MLRPLSRRFSSLFKNAKQPVRTANLTTKLAFETMEDRVVPATYVFDQANARLTINLETDEVLTVTANSVFTLTAGDGTPIFTKVNPAGTTATGDGTAQLDLADADVANTVVITNSAAGTASTNTVIFNGTLTSANIAVLLTDSTPLATDLDDIQVNAGTLGGAGATVSLQTQNGQIANGGGLIQAGTLSLSATTGVGVGTPIATDLGAAGRLAISNGTGGIAVNNIGTNLTIANVVTATTPSGTSVPGVSGISAADGNITITNLTDEANLIIGEIGAQGAAPINNAGTGTNNGLLTLTTEGNVIVRNSAITTASGAILITADSDNSNAGDLTVGEAGGPATSIATSAGGTITLGGAAAGATAENVTIRGTVTAGGGTGVGAGITINADDNITLNGAVAVTDATRGIVINADLANNDGVFSNAQTGTVTTGGGSITALADDINLAAAVNAGSGFIAFNVRNPNETISLGSAGGANNFGLVDGDFDLLTAASLRVGSPTNNADILFNGAAITAPSTLPLLILSTNTAIVDTNGTDTTDLTVGSLSLRAGTNAGTAAAALDLDVDNLAVNAVAGEVGINNAGDVTIGVVGGVAGQSGVTAGNAVTIGTTGSLTVAPSVSVAAGANFNVLLAAAANLTVSGTVATTGGGFTTLSVDRLFSGVADADAAGGILTLSTGSSLTSANPVFVNGGDQADTFNIVPQPTAVINVFGNGPGAAPGDVLNVDPTGAMPAANVPDPNVGGAGMVTSTNRQVVNYVGIETVNLQAAVVTTVTITPATASASVPGANNTPPATTATLTVNRDNSTAAQSVTVTLTGTAAAGSYTVTVNGTAVTPDANGTITIPFTVGGPTTATIGITPTTATAGQTVIATVSGSGFTVGAANSSTVTFTAAGTQTSTVNAAAGTTPVAAGPNGTPAAVAGTIVLTRDTTTTAQTVAVDLSGTAAAGSFTVTVNGVAVTPDANGIINVPFAVGVAQATIAITPTTAAAGQTIIATVQGDAANGITAGTAATLTVAAAGSIPTVTAVSLANPSVPGTDGTPAVPGVIGISRDVTTAAQTVTVTLGGTAPTSAYTVTVNGVVTPVTGNNTISVSFAPGVNSATIGITPNATATAGQTVTATVQPGSGVIVGGGTANLTFQAATVTPPPSNGGSGGSSTPSTPATTTSAAVSGSNVVLGKTDGSTQTVTPPAILGVPLVAVVGTDLNGNGSGDVFVLMSSGAILAFDGTTGQIVGLFLFDLTGDGVNDAAVLTPGGRFLIFDGATGATTLI